MKITNLQAERGEPAVRMAAPKQVSRVVQGPDGKLHDVPVPGFKMPNIQQNILAAAGFASPGSRAIPTNKDGRPATDMTVLGGNVPRPPMAPYTVVHKG
jgi:hypothetical protein